MYGDFMGSGSASYLFNPLGTTGGFNFWWLDANNDGRVNADEVETNMIMLTLNAMTADIFLEKLAAQKVLALPFNANTVRIVTHKDIDDSDIERAVTAIREAVA